MKIYKIFALLLVALTFSTGGLANPGLLWGLVKKATQGSLDSQEWARVKHWLTTDSAEDIDWRPAGEESARELMQRHNPELYHSLFGLPAGEPNLDSVTIEIVPPARPFLGMGAYGESQGELGLGFTGAVVKRVHRLSGELVAVKTLRRAQCEEHGMPFPPQEGELMALLWHPNIVRLYEAITTQEAQHLIMELVAGGDLFEFANSQGLIDEPKCKAIIRQLLKALDCMHRARICHRDLKPENLLIDDTGTVKVIDLGLACFFDPDRRIDEYCGSPEYAAPEVLSGIPYVGPELDVWAVAVILYDLAIGTLPFETPKDTVALRYEFPEDVELSEHFRDLINAVFQQAAKRASLDQLLKHKWTKEDL